MNKLLYWSHRNDDHPVVLSCAFLTPQGVTVDLFSLGSDARSFLLRLVQRRGGAEWADRDTRPDPRYDAAIAQARREQAAQNRRRRMRDLADEEDGLMESVSDAGNTDDPVGYTVGSDPDPYRNLGRGDDVPGTADRPRVRLAIEATRRAVEIENELYRDAAELIASDQTVRRTLLGRSVVGSWVPLDLFADAQPPRQLFFGLLDEELRVSVIDDLQVDRRSRPSGDGNLDVDVTSRMVVAITKRSSASPPSWEEVQETLRRR